MTRLIVPLVALLLSACAGTAAPYAEASDTRKFLSDVVGGARAGFDVHMLDRETWQVTFEGNSSTTQGTAQTYGLYRCAVITLENGYDGFEILSDTRLDDPSDRPYDQSGASSFPIGGVLVFALMGGDSGVFPVFSSDIKLVKKPLSGQPPKVFDAAALKAALEPYVMGKKCELGNVCAHDRSYLRPGAS